MCTIKFECLGSFIPLQWTTIGCGFVLLQWYVNQLSYGSAMLQSSKCDVGLGNVRVCIQKFPD